MGVLKGDARNFDCSLNGATPFALVVHLRLGQGRIPSANKA